MKAVVLKGLYVNGEPQELGAIVDLDGDEFQRLEELEVVRAATQADLVLKGLIAAEEIASVEPPKRGRPRKTEPVDSGSKPEEDL